jgi:protein SERAC1
MWLRHFLAKDFPRCRVMIYGYNSKLSTRGIQRIEDYGVNFLREIERIRGNGVVRMSTI